MKVSQLGDGEVVGDQNAVKTPFVTQDIVEKVLITVRRNAVHLVVRRHHTLHVAFFHSGFKRLEEIFAYHTFGIVAGRSVGPSFRLAVNGKMFCCRNHMRAVNERPLALKALDCSYADARNEIWVFTVGLFRPAPARLAPQIQYRRETLLRATGPNFSGSRTEDVMNQVRVPGGSKPDRRRERSALQGCVAVQAFFMEDDRDAEPRFLLDPALHGVGELRHVPRPAVLAGT